MITSSFEEISKDQLGKKDGSEGGKGGALLPRPHAPFSTAGFRAQISKPFKEP